MSLSTYSLGDDDERSWNILQGSVYKWRVGNLLLLEGHP